MVTFRIRNLFADDEKALTKELYNNFITTIKFKKSFRFNFALHFENKKYIFIFLSTFTIKKHNK